MKIISAGWRDHLLKNERIRDKKFSYWTLSILIHGETLFESGGEITLLKKGLYLIPPYMPYHLRFGGQRKPWTEAWVVFEPRREWKSLLNWPKVFKSLMSIPIKQNQSIKSILSEMSILLRYLNLNERVYHQFVPNALERILLLCQNSFEFLEEKKYDSRVQTIVEYFQENYRRVINLDELAHHVNLSSTRLSHLFKKEVGMPPMKYLESIRMSNAKELLISTNMSIKSIADELGFKNEFYFSTCFKKSNKLSPKAYRSNPR